MPVQGTKGPNMRCHFTATIIVAFMAEFDQFSLIPQGAGLGSAYFLPL